MLTFKELLAKVRGYQLKERVHPRDSAVGAIAEIETQINAIPDAVRR
jgi:hypothetical protein